jgi:DNA-binding NarL/FixJ family response regulator
VLTAVESARPDVVLMDVRMPIERAARLHPSVSSRVLTVYRDAPGPAPRHDDVLGSNTAREREVLALIG